MLDKDKSKRFDIIQVHEYFNHNTGFHNSKK